MRSQWRLVDVQLPSLMHLGAELFKACADESQRLVWRGWCSMRSQWRLVDVQLPSLMHLGAELFKACADESQRLVWRGWCSLRSQWRLGDVHQGEHLQRVFVFAWVHVTAVF